MIIPLKQQPLVIVMINGIAIFSAIGLMPRMLKRIQPEQEISGKRLSRLPMVFMQIILQRYYPEPGYNSDEVFAKRF
jgi:hypothetical protein